MGIRSLALVGLTVASCSWAIAYWHDERKIDEFCSRVNVGASMGDLPRLAERVGVDLYGPKTSTVSSSSYLHAFAEGPIATGYACDIRGEVNTQAITYKHLGYGKLK